MSEQPATPIQDDGDGAPFVGGGGRTTDRDDEWSATGPYGGWGSPGLPHSSGIPAAGAASGTPILDDQPASVDALDFASYVQALKGIVNHADTKTPLTMGIFGHWGMGKTTLMSMLERELRAGGMATVWFNAWQYSRENELWSAFLQAVVHRLQAGLRPPARLAFRLRLLWRRIDWRQVPAALVKYAILAVLVVVPLMLIRPVAGQLQPGAEPVVEAGGAIATLVLGVWTLGIPLVDAIRQNASIVFRPIRKAGGDSERIAFLDRFRDHFQDVIASLPVHGDKRLAVFIDDLDRCSPGGTLEVLDAIKLFLDVPGCVYVLGLDVDVVQRAVATRYPDDAVAQREFLGKIIQLPFQLPVLTQAEMSSYLRQLRLTLPDPRCEEVFVTGLIANPREVKRAINVFALLWNLATTRPELVGRIKPVRLAKVVVIQHGYPELHRQLQQRPLRLALMEQFLRQEATTVMMAPPAGADSAAAGDGMAPPGSRAADPRGMLPAELAPAIQIEPLRRMLLLHPLTSDPKGQAADECCFAHLGLGELAVYFTLTSRAEAPRPVPVTAASSAWPSPVTEVREAWGTPGQVLGKYRIIGVAGQGGSAMVYQAEDTELQRVVALKVLSPALTSDPSFLARFEREAKIIARLSHPNLVAIYDTGTLQGRSFYAMEWLPGGDLRRRLVAGHLMTAEQVAEWALPILDALQYAHQNGIVHRDIKPSSILFDAAGRPVLTDFSISRGFGSESDITMVSQVIGTPLYMAPEQWEGAAIDPRTDLYAFGSILFECLTGRALFADLAGNYASIPARQAESAPPSLRDSAPEVPPAVDDLVQRLLQKDPEKRCQSAREVADALRLALGPGVLQGESR